MTRTEALQAVVTTARQQPAPHTDAAGTIHTGEIALAAYFDGLRCAVVLRGGTEGLTYADRLDWRPATPAQQERQADLQARAEAIYGPVPAGKRGPNWVALDETIAEQSWDVQELAEALWRIR